MRSVPTVDRLGQRLGRLPWVRDLWVAGSLAAGDYIPGVSGLDLVAVVAGPVDPDRQQVLAGIHRELDRLQSGLDLGCVYVDEARLDTRHAEHPTWTHGHMVQRVLSGITRAELVRYGTTLRGRNPRDVLPAMSDDDLREAARAELAGFWT